MSDLVRELRNFVNVLREQAGVSPCSMVCEDLYAKAADEIERLQKGLNQFKECACHKIFVLDMANQLERSANEITYLERENERLRLIVKIREQQANLVTDGMTDGCA